MYFWGLFLKLLYKIKLGDILYPLFRLFNFENTNKVLPSVQLSKRIITDNVFDSKRFHITDSLHSVGTDKGDDYDVQIIVPVYNTEKYIRQCLNSILKQETDYKFQIIIINDGSTDGTCKILKEYMDNPLIKVINERNCGRSVARNTGLNFITSKYIMFIDSDDELAPNSIQNLLDNIYKTHSDIVFGGCRFLHKNGKLGKDDFDYKSNDSLHVHSDNDVDDSVWGKVFKSSLFTDTGIHFPVGYEFEDMMPAFLIYPLCQKMSSIDSDVYFYRYDRSGITHSFQFTNISIDSFLMLSLMIKSLHKYHIPIDQYIYETFLNQVKITCMRNVYINTRIQKSIFVLICQLYYKYFKNFSTNIEYNIPLEKSLENKDFMDYILFCIMK